MHHFQAERSATKCDTIHATDKSENMTNAYSFDGLVVFGLLLICTCAYMKRVPKLKQWFLSEKKGFLGVFYKGAVIGSRLHIPVAIACVTMGIYVLFIK